MMRAMTKQPVRMFLAGIAAFALCASGCEKKDDAKKSAPANKTEAKKGDKTDVKTVTATPKIDDTGAGRTMTPPAKTGAGPMIKLLDAGAEPRRPLRYKLDVGAKDKLVMDMDVAIETKMPGMALPKMTMPTISMTMDIEVTEKVSDTEAKYQFVMSDVQVKDRPGSMPGMSGNMQMVMNKAKGMSGTAIVDTRGINRDATMTLPEGMDAQMKQMMGGSMQNMEQLSAPLPEEAVGQGAKWELHQSIEQNGMKVSQVVLYELIELSGDTGKMTATITQKADKQNVAMPNMPGAKAELLYLKSTGNGETGFDLTKLVPSSTVSLVSDYSMNVEAQGQKQKVDAHLEMAINIRR